MLRWDLCNYRDAYIVVKEGIDLFATAENENDKDRKIVAFIDIAPFRSCISKINSALIDNAEDLDIAMPMYNLLEYSQNYSMTSENLWNYYRDEIHDVHDNASDGKSFKYKTKIVGKTKNPRKSTKTTTKSRWNSSTMTTTTSNTNFKCWTHYFTQIS